MVTNLEQRVSDKILVIESPELKFEYFPNFQNLSKRGELVGKGLSINKLVEFMNKLINSKLNLIEASESKLEIKCLYDPRINILKPIDLTVSGNKMANGNDFFRVEKMELAYRICAYAIDKLKIAENWKKLYGEPETVYDPTIERMLMFLENK
ncbi:MAG: hypothetical protein KC589_01175 [Nanoarchaeota archaeon]|nr:hypothetical protein [Nanoarchaeota archaeon]